MKRFVIALLITGSALLAEIAEVEVDAGKTLLHLQDSPVDVANYYSSESYGFGMFTPAVILLVLKPRLKG